MLPIQCITSSSNCKHTILDALSKRYSLTANELFQIIKGNYTADISYKAVHKSLKELQKDGFLVEANKRYSINSEWADYLINFGFTVKSLHGDKDNIITMVPKQSVSFVQKYRRRLLKKYAYLRDYIVVDISRAELTDYKTREIQEEKCDFSNIFENIDGNSFLLLGENGSGKTTLLKSLIYQKTKDTRLVPIFLSLNNYYGEDLSVMIARRIGYEIDLNIIEKMLDEGFFLILFDGLDEAQGTVSLDGLPYNRQELTTDQINKMMTNYNKNKFVVSCRTYNDPMDRLVRMPAFIVNPLSEKGIKKYLERRGAFDLYENLKQHQSIAPLFRNPLFLSTLIKRHDSGSLEAENKYEICKSFVNHILLCWECKYGKLSECTTNEVLKILARVAYSTLEKGNVIRYEMLRPEINHKEELSKIIFNAGLIKRSGSNYSFMYYCFQDYFAAHEFNYKVKNGLLSEEDLKSLLVKDVWHEVVSIYSNFGVKVPFVVNALIDLHIETNEKKYLDLAKTCLENEKEPLKELMLKVDRLMEAKK